MKCFSLVLGLLLCVCQNINAQNEALLEAFKLETSLKHASWSLTILDLNSQELLYQHKSQQSLIPASTLKLVTTGLALKTLGADFRFETVIGYTGLIEDNILKGDLVVRGYGDPTFGSSIWPKTKDLDKRIQDIRIDLKEKGIQTIQGDIIIDDSYINDYNVTPSWLWEDLGNYYASGIWGVNVNENLYNISLQQNNYVGEEVGIDHISPEIEGMHLTSQLTSGIKSSGDQAYVFGSPGSMERIIKGTIPVGVGIFKIKGSIPNPPLFFGQYLANALDLDDKNWKGQVRVVHKEVSFSPLFVYHSPYLAAIIKRTNYKSNNLYCESLFRALGYVSSCHTEIDSCINFMNKAFENKGISTDGLFLKDGSGLSPRSGISTEQMTHFLASIYKDKNISSTFLASIKKENKWVSKGDLYIKSGSMGQVRAYAGYYVNENNKAQAFSFIVNNFTGSSRDLGAKMRSLIGELVEGR